VWLQSSADIASFISLFESESVGMDESEASESRKARAVMVRPWVKTLVFDHWDPTQMADVVNVLDPRPEARAYPTANNTRTAEQEALQPAAHPSPCTFTKANCLRISRVALEGMVPHPRASAISQDIARLQSALQTLSWRIIRLEHLCVVDLQPIARPNSEDATFLDILQPGLRYLGRVTRKCAAKSVSVHHAAGLTASSFAVAGLCTRLFFPAITSGLEGLCKAEDVQRISGSIAASLGLWKRPLRWEFIVPDTLSNRLDIARLRMSWERAIMSSVRASIQVAVWGTAVKAGDESLGQLLLEVLNEVETAGLVNLRLSNAGEGCVVCRR